MRSVALVLGAAVMTEAVAQADSPTSAFGLEPGERSVGFRLIEAQDLSRAVTGGFSTRAHPRPIRIYLWYPANGTNDPQVMRFGRYAALADEDVWPPEIAGGLNEKLNFSRGPLARSLGPERFETLLQRPVLAVENAEALVGPFPLIVIGQGLYYEFPIAFAALAEYLAGRGFVVATAPLVGTNSALVRIDIQDLETQVRDLEFVIGQARRLPFVSSERLGVFGFDMGGMAGVILSMRNPDVDAFVSAASGILYPHPSGLPGASPHYAPSALHAAWLHIGSFTATEPPDTAEARSLFDMAVHSSRYFLMTEGMAHTDFTSYALVEDRAPLFGYWNVATPQAAKAHRMVAEYVYNFFAAFLAENARSLEFLSLDPEEAFPGSKMTLEHHAAIPAAISYDEFVLQVVGGQADEAINQLRSSAVIEPDHILFDETYLFRLTHSLLNTWALAGEAIPVIEFLLERYPSSANAHLLLGEAHILREDYAAAIEAYTRLLERYPDNAWGQTRLEWLRMQ
jgi:dienelactone hydrolase